MTMDSADEPRTACVVFESPPNLVHERTQAGIRDERRWPHARMQVLFAERDGTILEEHRQQVECLRRQVDWVGSAQELTRRRVENEWIETELHDGWAKIQ